MKKIKNYKKENKNSILGIILAFILLLTFNYSPISLISMSIANNKKSSAYSSTTSQTYYGDGTVKQESGFNAGSLAEGTSKYFEGSTNNYNILKNYSDRYNKLFKEYVDKFLVAQDTADDSGYNGKYSLYLKFINQKSLSSFYEANSSASLSSYATFRDYFEYFVTNEVSWTDSENVQHTLPALKDKTATDYKSLIYNSLANYLENSQVAIDGNDGLTSNESDFYTNSVSFKRVKTFIDNEIKKTTVITTYDGKSQDDYVAAILANKAPVIQGYYYDTDDFETIRKTSFSYQTDSYQQEGGVSFHKPMVYYFGTADELTSEAYNKFVTDGYRVNTNYGMSELENSALYYRPIQKGEFGYFDESHPTYYKYVSIPYDVTNSNYELFVIDDDVTVSEQATYDSLYYVHVVTSDEINKDKTNNTTTENGVDDTRNCFYVQVPYVANSTTYGDIYFKKLFSTISDTDYQRIKDLFTDVNGNSKVYFKISSSTYTSAKNVVYLDTTETDIATFKANNPTYNYTIKELTVDNLDENPNGITLEDYELVEAGTASYVKDYPLYHKKVRTYFETTTTEYSNSYVTSSNPSIKYEETTISSNKYDNFDIYALIDTLEISNVKYNVVTKDLIEFYPSLYSVVTDNQNLDSNYTFYYKHTIGENGNVNVNEYETLNGEKTIYVYSENVTINEKSYATISSDSLETITNLYTKVPSSVSSEVNGESNSYSLYYKHSTETVNQIYIVDDAENAKTNQVYKNLNYKVLSNEEYKKTFYNYVEINTVDKNYNKNFKLYYKLDANFSDSNSYISDEDMFIQNKITGNNAIYIIDDSLTSTDKASYKSLYYTRITTDEFNKNSDFYVLINENDDNYSTVYTKLYYKYNEVANSSRTIYVYSKEKSDIYQSFYSTDTDYDPNAYELIQSDDPNYVSGLELYYKKKVSDTVTTTKEQESYYYFKTSSTISLKANSYYVLSFYAYTNGNYYDEENNLVNNDISASVYITDNEKIISDISIENISTNGEWVQYNAFIATDAVSESKVYLSMYLGNKNSIAGNSDSTNVTGTVLFDNIKVTLIGETDYNNKTIDAKPVQDVVEEHETTTENLPIVTQNQLDEALENEYVKVTELQVAPNRLLDSENTYYYKHIVNEGVVDTENYEKDANGADAIYVYQADTTTATTVEVKVITETTKFENVDKYKNKVKLVVEHKDSAEDHEIMIAENEKLNNRTTNSSVIPNWTEDFNLDASSTLSNRIDGLTFDENQDGFTSHTDWHYYISREHSGQGNNEILKSYRQAYTDKKVTVSVVEESTIDKTVKEDEEDKKEEDKKEETTNDVPTIESTFIDNNKVLKIENTDRLKSLGIASNTFNIKQNEYYKVTVWIYSPDKDATATIKVESILKTASTSNQGSLISASASKTSAYLKDYDKAPTNEYSWIPVSFFIEGNAYHNQDVNLVLLADADSTVYFDNITIEKVNSTIYDKTNSDSDSLTTCITLSPTNSVITNGITNGYFNLMAITKDYVNLDYSVPQSAENWTVSTNSSSNVIAGVVPTSESYIENSTMSGVTNNFFTKYNNGQYVSTNGFNNSLFAIYAPSTAKASINTNDDAPEYNVKNNYYIYSASTSLSATTLYEISFEFYSGHGFSGNMVANLYSSSVKESNILTQLKVSSEDMAEGWTKYTIYAMGGSASTNVYLEIGVEDAVGTCFFQKVTCVKSSHTSIEAARDTLVSEEENVEGSTTPIYNYSSLSKVRFVNLGDTQFSVHSNVQNENGLFNSTNYTNSAENTSGYTVGETGTVISSFYTSTTSAHYTAEMKDVKYIKDSGDKNYSSETDADNIFYVKEIITTDENTNETTTTYKLYSDSMFTVEVLGFDVNKNKKVETDEIGNYTITKTGSTVKITVGETDTVTTIVNKTTYEYKFNEDVVINNTIIPAEELTNTYSQNLLIISNSYSTDYTLVTPRLVGSVSSSSFYVLKVYVKTSDITAHNTDSKSGLNISIDSVKVNWNNINTTTSQNADENGFVCYELWLKTNKSSFSEFKVNFSLGSEKSPCSGYAIIAGVSLEKFASETLFNEYCEANEELYLENDESSVAKRFYGTEDTKKDETSDDEKDDEDSSIWATFFYIFSSLLLGIVLIIALVAIFIKKHPIKNKKNDSDIIVVNSKEVNKKDDKNSKKNKEASLTTSDEKSKAKNEVKEEVSNEESSEANVNEENTESQESNENSETETVSEDETKETEKKQDSNGDEGFL